MSNISYIKFLRDRHINRNYSIKWTKAQEREAKVDIYKKWSQI